MEHNYPFTAIIGQEKMKLALILNLINPALGGVLIRGEKGTAKSTAVIGISDYTHKHQNRAYGSSYNRQHIGVYAYVKSL